MVQKSGDHQLRLVVYPIICSFFFPSQVVVWDFFHQQYVLYIRDNRMLGPFLAPEIPPARLYQHRFSANRPELVNGNDHRLFSA